MDKEYRFSIYNEIGRYIHNNMSIGGYCSVNNLINELSGQFKKEDVKRVLKEDFVQPNSFGHRSFRNYATQEASSNKEIGIIIESPLIGDRDRNILFIREI